MKFRFIFALAIGLIVLIAFSSLLLNRYIQPLLPGSVNDSFLIFISAIGSAMVFLALLKDILELADRLFGNIAFHGKYDVYISHSSTDLPFVEIIVNELKLKGIKTWLTDQQIRPGQSMEEELSSAMKKSKSAVFFIGSRGITNWQEKELNWAVSNNVHVIPVLLPGISFAILNGFSSLRDRYTIQFSAPNDTQAFDNLLRGVRG